MNGGPGEIQETGEEGEKVGRKKEPWSWRHLLPVNQSPECWARWGEKKEQSEERLILIKKENLVLIEKKYVPALSWSSYISLQIHPSYLNSTDHIMVAVMDLGYHNCNRGP